MSSLPVDNPVVVALDVSSPKRARRLAEALRDKAGAVKIGLQLFCSAGPGLVREMRENGIPVFLDLKLHDIPNTVARALEEAVALDVQMATLHTLGGVEMMRTARERAQERAGRLGREAPLLLGVTVLTGMDGLDLEAVGIPRSVGEETERLVDLGLEAGLGGFVCSPLEVERLRRRVPPHVKLVTPGIRPPGASRDDQKRVMGPAEALEAGADWLVIGRPVVAAEDPREALESIHSDIRSWREGRDSG